MGMQCVRQTRGAVSLWIVVVALLSAVATPAAAQTAGDWAPAAGAVGDNTYMGFVDEPAANATVGASFNVTGWIVDTSAQGWAGIDDVEVLLGGTSLAHLALGVARPDVASALGNPYFANAGFSGAVGGVPAGSQTLTILAHTPGKGSWSTQVTVNVGSAAGGPVTSSSALVVKIISPTPDDVVSSNNNGTIFGTAYDTRTRQDLGSGVDRVQVYLDGPRGQTGSQTLGDAVLSGANWTLAWEPTKYNSVRHHILYVYAHSAVTGEELLVNQEVTLSG